MSRGWLIGLGLLVACTNTSTHEVVVVNDVDPNAPATFLVMGEAKTQTKGAELVAVLPTRYAHTDKDGMHSNGCVLPVCGKREGDETTLSVKLETPCGPVEYCVRFPQDRVAGSAPMPPKGEPLHGTMPQRKRRDLCDEEIYRVWVDNRGGPSRTLALGNSVHVIAANTTPRIDVPAPPCDGMGAVALDGAAIGSLPVLAEDREFNAQTGGPHDFLVDPGAARCYVSTRFSYGISQVGPDNRLYHGAAFYPLTHPIDAFLEKAPVSIQAYGGGHRTQLLEQRCD